MAKPYPNTDDMPFALALLSASAQPDGKINDFIPPEILKLIRGEITIGDNGSNNPSGKDENDEKLKAPTGIKYDFNMSVRKRIIYNFSFFSIFNKLCLF